MRAPEETSSPEISGPKAVLAGYLSDVQATVARALAMALEHDDPEQAMVAARLIQTSIDLVAALEGRKLDFTYRFIDERNPPRGGVEEAPLPPPQISANHT